MNADQRSGTPGRRKHDGFSPRENWYRDVWLVLATGLVVWALILEGGTIDKVQQGRRAGTRAICAVLSGVTEAGRAVIGSGATAPETPFTRNLERLGYPPRTVRISQANHAASAYVNGIADHIERAVGRKGIALVKRDGTIDCQAFATLAQVK